MSIDHSITFKNVILQKRDALELLADQFSYKINAVVELIKNIKGRLIVSGIGKSGYIARKIAASFASTGTAAQFIHSTEASHGDLGMIASQDIVMLLSNSGETNELNNIISYCKRYSIAIIGITGNENSVLYKASNFPILLPKCSEASIVDAPTTSTTMMLAIGDALMVAVHEAKGFTKEHYKIFHPGGAIGKNLLKISDVMHNFANTPTVGRDYNMKDVLIEMTSKSFGCAVVIDESRRILGIITDGDLRRHFEDDILNKQAFEIMSNNPKTMNSESFLTEALAIMQKKAITCVVVVDGGVVTGIVHIHDLLRIGIF